MGQSILEVLTCNVRLKILTLIYCCSNIANSKTPVNKPFVFIHEKENTKAKIQNNHAIAVFQYNESYTNSSLKTNNVIECTVYNILHIQLCMYQCTVYSKLHKNFH